MTSTLFVPTLNEIDGMRAVMPQVDRRWCDQILVVDGGSTDGTQEYARAEGYEVVVQRGLGIRAAYQEGFPLVRGDVVVTFSPDGNSLPALIPPLIDAVEAGQDMVIASRYLDGARSFDDDLLTGFGNWMFTRLINVVHRARYTDAMVILRAYRTRLFWELGLDDDRAYAAERLFWTRVGIEPLLSIRAARRGLRVSEIPGDEPPRIGGVRKLRPFRWGATFLAQIVQELYASKRGR